MSDRMSSVAAVTGSKPSPAMFRLSGDKVGSSDVNEQWTWARPGLVLVVPISKRSVKKKWNKREIAQHRPTTYLKFACLQYSVSKKGNPSLTPNFSEYIEEKQYIYNKTDFSALYHTYSTFVWYIVHSYSAMDDCTAINLVNDITILCPSWTKTVSTFFEKNYCWAAILYSLWTINVP